MRSIFLRLALCLLALGPLHACADAPTPQALPEQQKSETPPSPEAGRKLQASSNPFRLDFTPDCSYPEGTFTPESRSRVAYKPASAWTNMAPWAFWAVSAARPLVVAELGSHNGYSTFAFAQAVAEAGLPTHIYAIDTWEGDRQAGYYDNATYQAVEAHTQAHHASRLTLLRMTFDEALGHIDNNSVDLLHIDGLHHYDNVSHDFNTWLPKMSSRGVVLFHDIDITSSDFGVHQKWAELAAVYPSFAFHQGPGLGILGVGRDLPAPFVNLFASHGTPEGACVQRIYARLGAESEAWLPPQ